MTRYYVKHWVSKLADPKIARLPDWRLTTGVHASEAWAVKVVRRMVREAN